MHYLNLQIHLQSCESDYNGLPAQIPPGEVCALYLVIKPTSETSNHSSPLLFSGGAILATV